MNGIQLSTSICGGERWRKQLISNCFFICWKLNIISSLLLQQSPQMPNFVSCRIAERDLPKLREKQDRNRDPYSIWFLHKYSISSHWTPPSSQSLTGCHCPTPASSCLTPLPAFGDPCGSGTSGTQPAKAPTAVASNMLWVFVHSALWGIVPLQSILDLNCLSI